MSTHHPGGLSRRRFLAAGALAAGVSPALVAQLASPEAAAEIDLDTFELPRVALGQTGLRPSLLGFGTGKYGPMFEEDGSPENRRRLVSLLEYAYDRGVRYFDCADQYGSHPFMHDALRENGGTIPREDIVILTKTLTRQRAGVTADLERFRQELGTDYFDILLFHCAEDADWHARHAGALDAMSMAKGQGVIRNHGVSCHTIQALRTATTVQWVEVNLARLNPWADVMDADTETVQGVLRQMKGAGKGVIGMKILANGHHAAPAERAESLRLALTCGVLDCFTIGFRTREEFDQVLRDLALATRAIEAAAQTSPDA